ncbi:MAG: diguanylate cyclase domain-containing protein [Bacillota bacterium]
MIPLILNKYKVIIFFSFILVIITISTFNYAAVAEGDEQFSIKSSATYNTFKEKVQLTAEEQQWIKANPEVSVAVMKRFPPFSYTLNQETKPQGFSIDLLKLIARKSGLDFNLKPGFWSENLSKFRTDQVDLITGISYNQQRDKYISYTEPYYKIPLVVYVQQDAEWYQNPEDLEGKKVGITEDVFFKDSLEEELEGEIIEESNNEQLMNALAFGKFDAVITNLSIGEFYIQKNVLKNLKLMGRYNNPKIKKEDLRIGVQQEKPILKRIIEKSLAAITETEWTRLKRKWLGLEEEWINSNDSNNTNKINNLTSEEEQYLKEKDKISIVANPKWMPFEKISEQGDYEGVVAQFYQMVSNKLGIEIELVETSSWEESVEKLKKDQADILSTAVKSRDKGLKFTQPYIKYPLVIATRQEELYINNLKVIKDKKIGLSLNCPVTETIKNKYPNLSFIEVKDTKAGLKKVQSGELFGVINTAPIIGYVMQQQNMINLKISGELEDDMALRIGVREEETVLLNILNKALQAIDNQEKEEIFNDWLTINYQQSYNYSLFIKVLAGIIVIASFMLYRQYQLQKFNEKLSSVNDELEEANKKLKNTSFIDGLTQIPNRRKFDEFLEQEWQHCKRNKNYLSLIMLDLDFFKEYNDCYGHLAGDDCLKKIANAIQQCVKRPKDLAARYGGEEFIIVLSETGAAGAQKVAQRIQTAINNLEIEHQDSKVAEHVTVSLGVTTIIPDHEVTKEEFVDKADQVMYQAKQAGRNQIKIKVFD